MNMRQYRRRYSLESVLVEAVQWALSRVGVAHPDSKRTRRAKLEGRYRKHVRDHKGGAK